MVPNMNDPSWVASLPRVRVSFKYNFTAIHVLAPLRNAGVAPVVLQAGELYLRAPANLEASFELCLRHLHCMKIPWPSDAIMTANTLLADRAMEALRLPARFIPTVEGEVLDLGPIATPMEDTVFADLTTEPVDLDPIATPMEGTILQI